ncbi:hypothetical protein [Scytonema sp. HK-05]|nr:hypothetical protein [Scytonema sp. HK-05]
MLSIQGAIAQGAQALPIARSRKWAMAQSAAPQAIAVILFYYYH